MFENAKVRWAKFKKDAKDKAACCVVWVENNPELAIVIIPAAAAAIKGATKLGSKFVTKFNQDRMIKDVRTRCYDPSEGHYWFLKRELSNDEWLLVNRRHSNGERIGDILADLRVLK